MLYLLLVCCVWHWPHPSCCAISCTVPLFEHYFLPNHPLDILSASQNANRTLTLNLFQVTDYPPTPLKRAQQASLHLYKHPTASASAFYREQIQLQAQADMYPLSMASGNELISYTPQQAASPFFGANGMKPAFVQLQLPMAPMVCPKIILR